MNRCLDDHGLVRPWAILPSPGSSATTWPCRAAAAVAGPRESDCVPAEAWPAARRGRRRRPAHHLRGREVPGFPADSQMPRSGSRWCWRACSHLLPAPAPRPAAGRAGLCHPGRPAAAHAGGRIRLRRRPRHPAAGRRQRDPGPPPEGGPAGRRAFVSGKKKQNTIKFTKISVERGRSLADVTFRPGRIHDQTALRTDDIEHLLQLSCVRVEIADPHGPCALIAPQVSVPRRNQQRRRPRGDSSLGAGPPRPVIGADLRGARHRRQQALAAAAALDRPA